MLIEVKNKSRKAIGPALTAMLIASGGAARAESPANNAVIEDVVVGSPSNSAQQGRALQNKPVAATIVTTDQLDNLQITNLEGVKKLVPSLSYKYGNLNSSTFNIRGVGNANSTPVMGIFNGVGIYVDGVYLPLPGSWTTDIPDMSGVSVLKGPQGTRGGFDNTGGAVYISTAAPSSTQETKLDVSTGSYDFVQIKGSVTGPVFDSDWAAFRVAVFGKDRQGYVYSTLNPSYRYNDFRDKGGRAQLLLQPSNDLSARFSVDYSHDETHVARLTNGAMVNYSNGAPLPNNFFVRSARVGYLPINVYGFANFTNDLATNYPQEAVESYGASAHIKYKIGDYTFSSLTAFRQYDFHFHGYNNASINVDVQRQSAWLPSARSVQQDLSVATSVGDFVDVNAGLFYYWHIFRNWAALNRGDQAGVWFGNPTTPAATTIAKAALDGAGLDSYNNPESHSVAPYGQAIWHITPEFDVTTGLRYSYTARSSTSTGQTYGRSFDDLTPDQQASAQALRNSVYGTPAYWSYYKSTRQGLLSGLLSASYKVTPDITAYATYARGVRPGGPNASWTALPAGASTAIKPEEIDNYELGVKSEWFDGRLLANFAGFWMNDRNYITNLATLSPAGTSITTYMANAKRVISRGVEADLRAQPIEGLNLYGSGVFNDAFYASFESAPCPIEESNVYKTCNFTGRRLAIVPRWAFSTGGEYSHPLGQEIPFVEKAAIGFFGADFSWQSSYFSDAPDSIYSIIHSYGLLNFNIGVKTDDDSLKLTGWVHNALDKRYFLNVSATSGVGAGLIVGVAGDPLMAGVTIATKW